MCIQDLSAPKYAPQTMDASTPVKRAVYFIIMTLSDRLSPITSVNNDMGIDLKKIEISFFLFLLFDQTNTRLYATLEDIYASFIGSQEYLWPR